MLNVNRVAGAMRNAKCKSEQRLATFTFSIPHRSGDPVYI